MALTKDERAKRDDRIRELAAQGWTQRHIAEVVGCGHGTVTCALDPGEAERARQRSHAYYQAHREQQLAAMRENYQRVKAEDPERLRAQGRKSALAYYYRHTETVQAKHRAWSKSHREQQRPIDRVRYTANPAPKIASALKSRRKAQNETLDRAVNSGKMWTGPELEIAAREDLTSKQIALMLGRSLRAVEGARRKLREEPREIWLAGLSEAA